MTSVFKDQPFPIKDLDFSHLRLYSRFRRYPGFAESDCRQIFDHDLITLAEAAVCGVIVAVDVEVSLVALVVPQAWDSNYFGMKMGRLYLWKSSRIPDHECAQLMQEVLDEASREHGIAHISMELDVDDYEVMNLAFSRGFEVLDFKRAYFTNVMEVSELNRKGLSRVRPYVSSDYEAVHELVDDAQFETRYTRDPYLDQQRARDVYRMWFDSMLRGTHEMPAHGVVCERRGKVVGCGVIGEKDFRSYGLEQTVRTNSLVVCSRQGVGAYAPILTRMTLDALEAGSLIEAVVSLNNVAAARVVEGIRPNRSITTLCLRRYASGP